MRPTGGWAASLELGFDRRGARTVLSRRRHEGPLRVQKAFYPEGDAVCHVIVLHPPGGVVNGDRLSLHGRLEGRTHALLTTPGAGKWYRSAGAWAYQHVRFHVGEGARLEWLPQENIIYDGACAQMGMEVELAADACYIGWEVLCLGRRAAGERFRTGNLRLQSRLLRAGSPLWIERGWLTGASPVLQSATGLAGFQVSGTLAAAVPCLDPALLPLCRTIEAPGRAARTGITTLPEGVLVARYLGDSAEAARAWFTALWRLLRPALLGRQAQPPRIWST